MMYIKTMASWTPEEDKILLELYEKAPRKDILEKLPHRVWKSIYKRSVILGLYRPKEDAWTAEEDAILRELYINAPQEELEAKLPGRSWKAITFRGCNALRIFRSKEIKQKKVRQTNLLRRGVEYPTQSTRVKDKIKETVQKRYGVYNVFQAEEIKDKARETNLKNLGVENPQQNPTIKKKTEETCREKYGVSNPFQLVDRVQAGMLREHGVKSPLQNPDIKARQQATNIERYGAPVPAQNEKIQEKTESTNRIKYGFKTPFQNKGVKIKIRNKNLSLYGVENPAQNEKIKEKIQKTCFEKYGVRSFLCLDEIRRKGRELSIQNNSINKSKGENNFKQFLLMLDPETKQHQEHPQLKQVLDFYLPKYDLWVQYDGTYWHGKTKRKNETTRQYLKIQKTIKRDQLQNKLIPNLIRFWSDEVDTAIKSNTIFQLIIKKIDEKCRMESVCHQFKKKLEWYQEDLKNLPFEPHNLKASLFSLSKEELTEEIKNFIIKYEWLGSVGFNVKWCFTARYRGLLAGVVLISEPTSYSNLLGKDTPIYEALIQRGATSSWAPRNLGSRLIMFSCHWMVENTSKRIFIGYADQEANERGLIYRACNFDYLGDNFGESYLYKHPTIPKLFSSRYVRRTSTFKSWCRENKIELQNSWFKENEFKDLKNIPEDIKKSWYLWGRLLIKESEKIKLNRKLKYALLLAKNKTEKKYLRLLVTYSALPYPKN